jgi:hypothetical protein
MIPQFCLRRQGGFRDEISSPPLPDRDALPVAPSNSNLPLRRAADDLTTAGMLRMAAGASMWRRTGRRQVEQQSIQPRECPKRVVGQVGKPSFTKSETGRRQGGVCPCLMAAMTLAVIIRWVVIVVGIGGLRFGGRQPGLVQLTGRAFPSGLFGLRTREVADGSGLRGGRTGNGPTGENERRRGGRQRLATDYNDMLIMTVRTITSPL